MRVMVASQNRMAGLGLVSLSEGIGLSAELVSLGQVRAGSDGVDITLLYCDALDADMHQLVDALHAAHVRFIVMVGQLDHEERQSLLASGAMYAFGQEDSEDLSVVLTNYRWSAEAVHELTFANGFSVDLLRRRLQRGDRYVDLTLTECQFLTTFHGQARSHPGRPLSLPQINLAVWGFADARSPTTVRGYINQLRAKLEVEPDRPTVLLNERGRGYWLVLGK